MEDNRIPEALPAAAECKTGENAFRSLLFALWGIFLSFIALNPLGLFMFLWVLVIPAWFLGCGGLSFGIRSLLRREKHRLAAISGIALAVPIVILPLYPFIAAYYPGITKGQTARLLTSCSYERKGALWKARLHGNAILEPLREATNCFDINCPGAAENVLWILSSNRSSLSRAILNELAKRDNQYQRMTGIAGLVAHGVYFDKIDNDSYLIRTVRGYDPEKIYNSWHVRQALKVLGNMGGEDALQAILPVISRQKVFYGIRVEACDALRKLNDRRAIPALREYLKGPEDDASAGVFRCLISLGDSYAVSLAIDRVGRTKKPEREDQDIVKQLERVTGKRFGYHRAAWEAWWASVVAVWQIPEEFIFPSDEK